MKKTIFLVCLMIFSLGISSVWAVNSSGKTATDNSAVTNKENRLSDEEIKNLHIPIHLDHLFRRS
jgi:hypothetical protein